MSQDGFKLNLPLPTGKPAVTVEHPVAVAGTVVECPQCKDRIGVLRRTLYHAMTVAADSIAFEPAQYHDHSEGAVCKKCGATYMATQYSAMRGRRILLHTPMGWV